MSRALILAAVLASAATPALARHPLTSVPMPPSPAGTAPQEVLTQPIEAAAGAQRVMPGTAVSRLWWQAFGNDALNQLVSIGLAHNNDLAAARANVRQANELTRAARGVLFPQIDAGYSVERQRLSEAMASPVSDPNASLFSLHTAQVSIGYSLDFYGNAARIRSAKAAARATAARAEGVETMVAANIILAVIQNAGLDAQANAARLSIESNREILRLLKVRQSLGAVGAADIAAQETALAASEGVLPSIERARLDNLAALNVLLGQAPGTALPPLPSLEDLQLPDQLPLSLPSELLAERPDVKAAAAAMEGASADVDAALAARLPSLTLAAAQGGIAPDFATLFKNGNPFWTILGSITAPLFHGGQLRHRHHAAEAALDVAKAQYRGIALQAFADVSNALTALATDASALDAASRADRSAQTSLGFVTRQLELGSVGTYAVLNAKAAAQIARSQWITARMMRLSDSVGLFTALGGNVASTPPSTPAKS